MYDRKNFSVLKSFKDSLRIIKLHYLVSFMKNLTFLFLHLKKNASVKSMSWTECSPCIAFLCPNILLFLYFMGKEKLVIKHEVDLRTHLMSHNKQFEKYCSMVFRQMWNY